MTHLVASPTLVDNGDMGSGLYKMNLKWMFAGAACVQLMTACQADLKGSTTVDPITATSAAVGNGGGGGGSYVSLAGDAMTGALTLPANGLVLGTNQFVTNAGSIGVGTATPNSSSLMDFTSTTQGVLFPRMTAAQLAAIATPAVGLQAYQTDAPEGQYINTSTGWGKVVTTNDIGNPSKTFEITRTLPGASNYIELGYVGSYANYVNIQLYSTTIPGWGPSVASYTIPISSWQTANQWMRVLPLTQTGLANSWADGESFQLEYKFDNTTYGHYFRLKRLGQIQAFTVHISGMLPLSFYETNLTGTDNTAITTTLGTMSEDRIIGNNTLRFYGNTVFNGVTQFSTAANFTDSYAAAGTTGKFLNVAANIIDNATAQNATVATVRANNFTSPALSATNTGITTTNASNLYVQGSATASTNETLTNSYGVYVDTSGSGTNTYGLYVNGSSAGTNKYAASFMNGNVGIGTATPTYKLDVQGGNVNSSGAYTNTSDVRLKKDIVDLEDPLTKVLKLRAVSYFWKDQSFDTSKQVGLIAQEVEEVIPEVVKTDAKGFKTMSYSQLISPVIGAFKAFYDKWFADSQEIHRDLASVKAENDALKKENAAIKSYLCAKDPAAPICK